MFPDRRFVLFVAVGGIAALANFLSRIAFSHWVNYPVAIAFAYAVGMVVAFGLMRRFVFDGASRSVGPQVLKFTAVNAWGFVQTLVVSSVLACWALPGIGVVQYAEEIGHFLGLSLLTVTSYALHRMVTFR